MSTMSADEELKKVRLDEAECIIERRRNAFTPSDQTVKDPRQDLVGLALSGGGLRSAAYNLGFVQALSRYGLLRYVDYLCSVSGGGYLAGHITAAATKELPEGKSFHDTPEASFGADGNERLMPGHYRFRHLGEYLLNYASFAWRYFISTLGTLLLFVSLLGVLATIAALAWRSHDLAIARKYREVVGLDGIADWLGLGGEMMSAFLPSIMMFVAFLYLALVRHLAFEQDPPWWLKDPGDEPGNTPSRRGRPEFRSEPLAYIAQYISYVIIGGLALVAFAPWLLLQYLIQLATNTQFAPSAVFYVGLALLVAFTVLVGKISLLLLRLFDGSAVHGALWVWLISLGISLAVFLGNGESMFYATGSDVQIQSQWTSYILLTTILSLVPLALSGRLAKSGQDDAPFWKQWLFTVLLASATICAPFFTVHWMARENISGLANHRGPEFMVDDVLDWDPFLALFDKNAAGPLAGYLPAIAQDVENEAHAAGHLREQETNLLLTEHALGGRDTWERYRRTPLVAPLQGTERFVVNHVGSENVFHYLDQWSKQREAEFFYLQEFVNPLFMAYAKPALEQEGMSIKPADDKSVEDLTSRLMTLLVARAYEGGKEVSDEQADYRLNIPAASLAFDLKSTSASPSYPVRQEGLLQTKQRRAVEKFLLSETAKMKDQNRAKQLVRLWNQATLHNTSLAQNAGGTFQELDLTREQRVTFNRLLLECLFPDIIRSQTMVSTTVVPETDQWFRGGWLVVWMIGLVVGLFCIDFNHWSPFYSYYRDRLHEFCLAVFGGHQDYPLHKVTPWKSGGPYPLMLGSQFFFRRVRPQRDDTSPWTADSTLAADASRIHPFIFSPLYCGGPASGYAPTGSYCNSLRLADAVAISGAALTPLMVENVFFSALMAAFNLRIGQWLPRPHSNQKDLRATGWHIGTELWRAGANPKAYEAKWQRSLVADGGFHDFFGLEELLLRRCRVIVVSDAGCNNGRFEFGALADIIRLVRERHGIRILDLDNESPADLTLLRRDQDGANVQPLHAICLRVIYPPNKSEEASGAPTSGLLVYSQMSLTGREPLDLQQFRKSHPNFPDEPITNQFFNAKQVESYRQLGYEVGRTICRELPAACRPQGEPGDADLPPPARMELGEIGQGLVRSYLAELLECRKQEDAQEKKKDEVRAIDLFQTRQSWAWPLSLAVADYVASCVNTFLTKQANSSTAGTQPLPTDSSEADLANVLAREAIELLKCHRLQLGYPSAKPFLAGGRRTLIRALATVIQPFMPNLLIGDKPITLDEADLTLVGWEATNGTQRCERAWCALANLVFAEAGERSVAVYLQNLQRRLGIHGLAPHVEQDLRFVEEAIGLLKQQDTGRLRDLWRPDK